MQQGMLLNGTYRLEKEIGSGGGGIVYKAYHERLKIYVVVKQIREKVIGLLDSRAEADILKRLKHTYLPRVYDFVEEDGEIYTVMDFIPGLSFAEQLKLRGRFTQKEVLHWAVQLAEALSYLHSQDPPIIHSDIKPANIMLTPSGDVCLIDFNVSLAFDQNLRSSTGVSGGYSPPEQYHDYMSYRSYISPGSTDPETHTETSLITRGIFGRGVDERSDIYSLGTTLYHMLTGRKPVYRFGQMVPIGDFDIPLSEGFRTIIDKMLEPDPDMRYQNGTELLYALQHIYELDSEYKRYKRSERRKKIISALLLAGGIGLTGAGYLTMQQEKRYAYNRTVESAEELISDGDYKKASVEIERAIAMDPRRIGAYEAEMMRLYAAGDYAEAIRYGRDILNNPAYELNGESDRKSLGDILYILGNAYYEDGSYKNASACFRQALEYQPENGSFYRDYAAALAHTGNTDQAREVLNQARVYGLGDDSVYLVEGELAFAEGDYQTAVRDFQDTIQMTEDDTLKYRAVLLAADTYSKAGYPDQSIVLLESNIKTKDVQTLKLREKLAVAYDEKAKQDPVGAQVYYQKALEIFEEIYHDGMITAGLLDNMAIVYQEMNRLDEAGAVLSERIERYPKDYRGYMRMSFLEADKQNRFENSQRDYHQMKALYDTAKGLYEQGENKNDPDMQLLDNMIQDLKTGGWIEEG